MNTSSTHTTPSTAAAATSLATAQVWVALQFDAAIELCMGAHAFGAQSDQQQASAQAWRAAAVVQALQMTLDMRRGGELARQLFELFDYVQRRLRGSTAVEPLVAYREAADLLSQVRQAWQAEPELVPTHARHVTPQLH